MQPMPSTPREIVTAGVLSGLLSLSLAGCGYVRVPPPVAGGSASPAPVASVPSVPSARPSPVPPGVRVEVETGASAAPTGQGAYRYRVEVPRLTGPPEARNQAVGAVIRGRLLRGLSDFVEAAKAAPAGPVPSDLTCTSRTVRVTSRLAVLRVDCAEYRAGDARPSTVTHAFNCDLTSGRVLVLQDLFGPGSAYLSVLSAAAQAQLRAKLGPTDQSTLAQGSAPVVENFRVFLLDGAALVIVFARYQVAPEAAGEPEVSVPYAELQRYFARGTATLLDG
jgi:hypothetical protein